MVGAPRIIAQQALDLMTWHLQRVPALRHVHFHKLLTLHGGRVLRFVAGHVASCVIAQRHHHLWDGLLADAAVLPTQLGAQVPARFMQTGAGLVEGNELRPLVFEMLHVHVKLPAGITMVLDFVPHYPNDKIEMHVVGLRSGQEGVRESRPQVLKNNRD